MIIIRIMQIPEGTTLAELLSRRDFSFPDPPCFYGRSCQVGNAIEFLYIYILLFFIFCRVSPISKLLRSLSDGAPPIKDERVTFKNFCFGSEFWRREMYFSRHISCRRETDWRFERHLGFRRLLLWFYVFIIIAVIIIMSIDINKISIITNIISIIFVLFLLL